MTALAHGPEALGRHAGRVIFVPGAAPGDRVRIRVVEEHDNWARAELVHVCTPGPTHREPPCPWIASCGGCPWQHVDYATQLAAKQRNVEETLRRIGGVTALRPLPILASPSEWAYRHRIRLHRGPDGALGYRRARSHDVVAIEHCLIAEPELSAALPAVRALLAELETHWDEVELATNGRAAVAIEIGTSGRFRADDRTRIERWLAATPGVAGVGVRGRNWSEAVGDTRLVVAAGDDAPPATQRLGSFTQVSPAANRLLVQTVVDWTPAGARVLDLFCGAGNLGRALARVATAVVAVDRDAGGIADGAASAAAAGLANIRFEASAADRFLRRHGLGDADLVVLDPPRIGAASVVAELARVRPARILYVSCEPSTLARDVRTLTRAGYVVDRVQPLDMFPQTEHVETVLECVLTAP